MCSPYPFIRFHTVLFFPCHLIRETVMSARIYFNGGFQNGQVLHIYDEGRTAVKMGDLFGIVTEAEKRLTEKDDSVAP